MKRILIICLFLVGVIFIILGITPSIIRNIEIRKLEKEIIYINDYLTSGNISEINIQDLDKNITISNKKLELDLETNLKKIITIATYIDNINKHDNLNNALSINTIKSNELSTISDYLELTRSKLNKLSEEIQDVEDSKNNNSNKLYKQLIESINMKNYKKKITVNLQLIDNLEKILEFLKNNQDYKIEDNNMVFFKRNSYEELSKIINQMDMMSLNIFNYILTNDSNGPYINASNITLYEGIGVNLNSKITCVDEIDGSVPCVLEGSFDKNTIGSYPIKISATDKSGITSKKTIYVNIIEKAKLKYYTEIIRNYNTVIVYELDENKEYTKIAKVFPCSTGINGKTPTGIFYTRKGSAWGSLVGGVWGQYYTVIKGNILFHSVPYYTRSKDNLEWEEYNKLGSEASAGCVRLSVADSKWIFDNCPIGMKVKIYDGELPTGVSKPTAIKIDGNSSFRGWDPTDPDPNNPYHKFTSPTELE